MLHDDSGVGDQGPEVIGLQARVSLEVFEKGRLVGVIVRICSLHQPSSCPVLPFVHFPARAHTRDVRDLHDCLTHSNFFQALFLLRLRLRLPGSLLRMRKWRDMSSPLPPALGSKPASRLAGGGVARKASSGARRERSKGAACTRVRKGPGAVTERAKGGRPSAACACLLLVVVEEGCSPEEGAIAAMRDGMLAPFTRPAATRFRVKGWWWWCLT